MIHRKRLVDEFLGLVRTASLSRREGQVAKRLVATLEGLGAAVEIDDAGDKVGGDPGNVLARIPGDGARCRAAPALRAHGHRGPWRERPPGRRRRRDPDRRHDRAGR